jgi:hypothetical protein
MSYTIKLTNGKTIAVLADQSFDKVSTSLTLIGKNVNAYGNDLNNNFVGLLENFAGVTEPRSPIKGQTWFDTVEGRLKVYHTNSFKPVGAPITTNVEPSQAVLGDLWLNPDTKELKFYDGTAFYATYQVENYAEAGKAGWFVETIQDSTNDDHVVANLYSNDTLVASVTDTDINLNPFVPLLGTTTLRAGMTLNPSMKIYGTATNSLNWQNLSTSSFIQKGIFQATTGSLSIATNSGLYVGTASQVQVYVENTTATLFAATAGVNLNLKYNSPTLGPKSGLYIDSTNSRMGLFREAPATTLDVGGDVRIRGTLLVDGTSTTVSSNDLRITDKNIILADGNTSDAVADGGGITLKGTTDKIIEYTDINQSWRSNQHFDLSFGKSYRIGTADVITSSSLGTGIRHAPGIQALPAIASFTSTNFNIGSISSATFVGSIYGDTSTGSDLYITSRNSLINLGGYTQIYQSASTEDSDPDSTLITKGYFDDKLTLATGGTGFRKTYTMSMDITPVTTATQNDVHNYIVSYLSRMLPINGNNGLNPGDPGYDPVENSYYNIPIGARANVMCHIYTVTSQVFNLQLLKTTTLVNKGAGGVNNQSVLTDVATTGTAQFTSVYRPQVNHLVKSFKVMAITTGSAVGTWTFVSNIA